MEVSKEVKHFNEIPTKNEKLIKWVYERCAGTIDAEEMAIGYMPKAGDIDLNGLEEEVTAEDMRELLSVAVTGWKNEMESIEEHYARFGDKLPQELTDQLNALKNRLNKSGQKGPCGARTNRPDAPVAF